MALNCPINYKGTTYSPEDFVVVASLHNKVKTELMEGNLFNKFKGANFMSKNNIDERNKQMAKIASLNIKYGSKGKKVVSVDSNRKVIVNVNPVAQDVIKSYREAESKGKPGDQLKLFKLKKGEDNPNEELNTKIKEFLQKHGISTIYVKSLQEKTGVDAVGAYAVLEKTIYIAQGKEDLDTLPEEAGHAIVETIGYNHPLVKVLLTNLRDVDFRALVGEEYAKQYQDNPEILLREAAGQLIGKALTGKEINIPVTKKNKLLEIANKILNVFKRMFNVPITDLQSSTESIREAAMQLANKVTNNEEFDIYDFADTKPVNKMFFRLDKNQGKKKTDKKAEEIKKKIVYFKRVLKRLRDQYREAERKDDTEKMSTLEAEILEYDAKLDRYLEAPTTQNAIELGRTILLKVKEVVTALETGELMLKDLKYEDILFMVQAVNEFKGIGGGLSDHAIDLKDQLSPYVDQWIANTVNEHSTEGVEYDVEDLMVEDEDINRFRAGLGALADVADVIGRTIGTMIKRAQNRISTFNKRIAKEVESEVDKLKKYQSSKGLSGTAIFDVFIQDREFYSFKTKGFVKKRVLVTPYTDQYYKDRAKAIEGIKSGEPKKVEEGRKWFKDNTDGDTVTNPKYNNKNYEIVQATPSLKRFYDFYKKTMNEAFDKLPVNRKDDFIANIKDQTLQNAIKNKGIWGALKEGVKDLTEVQTVSDVQYDEDLLSDDVPLKYLGNVDPKVKTKDLGESLAIFASFANSHQEMSEVLPQARLLQEKIKDKNYTKSNDPKAIISGEDSNVFKMADDYIKMQVKGQMKDPMFKIPLGKGRFIHGSTLIDIGLRYNSLLRIGFNPFNAVTNVIVGEIGNKIEAFGGRFFNHAQLTKASSIFYSQKMKEDSKLNKLLELFPVLQELDDYEAIDKVKVGKKKWGKDKLIDYAYTPQKIGESFLQVRTMIASMLHDKIKDKNGKEHSLWEAFDEKGNWKTELFGELTEERIGRISDKILRINQMIHGRYSQKDAAAWSQNAIFRMAFQFKKWIPAAIEARMGGYQYDPRLGEHIEGRWRTLKNLVVEGMTPGKRGYMNMVASLFSMKKRAEEGGLTELEVANMRKNMVEIALVLASILLGASLLDDDWQKKNKRLLANPFVKFGFDQLERVSGDLLYFANPKEYAKLGKNSIPLAKTAIDLMNTALLVPYAFGGQDADYKSGPRKGENRFYSNLARQIPAGKPIADILTMFNEESYRTRELPD